MAIDPKVDIEWVMQKCSNVLQKCVDDRNGPTFCHFESNASSKIEGNLAKKFCSDPTDEIHSQGFFPLLQLPILSQFYLILTLH